MIELHNENPAITKALNDPHLFLVHKTIVKTIARNKVTGTPKSSRKDCVSSKPVLKLASPGNEYTFPTLLKPVLTGTPFIWLDKPCPHSCRKVENTNINRQTKNQIKNHRKKKNKL